MAPQYASVGDIIDAYNAKLITKDEARAALADIIPSLAKAALARGLAAPEELN